MSQTIKVEAQFSLDYRYTQVLHAALLRVEINFKSLCSPLALGFNLAPLQQPVK